MAEKIIRLEAVDSTNNYLKDIYRECEDGAAVIAKMQTGGRGRNGRQFLSPKNGLYLSYLIKNIPLDQIGFVTPLASLAVTDAVEEVCQIKPQIKWVNDIIINNRKVCGILAEAVSDNEGNLSVILGIGINVLGRISDFPKELSDVVTTLFAESGKETDIRKLAEVLISKLDTMRLHRLGCASDFVSEYKNKCINIGKKVRVIMPDCKYEAFVTDINDDYSVLVRDNGGIIRNLNSGEVSIRGIMGYL